MTNSFGWNINAKRIKTALSEVSFIHEHCSETPAECYAEWADEVTGEINQTTLFKCCCKGFHYSGLCRHMIRLAIDGRFIDPDDYEMETVLKSTDERRLEAMNKPTSFGCCNCFLQCSAIGQCVYESDSDLYLNCMYNRNLKCGRIFYGEKRNYPPKCKIKDSIILSFQDFLSCISQQNMDSLPAHVMISHSKYGEICFDILGEETDEVSRTVTLRSSYVLPDKLPFDTPKDKEPENLASNRVSYPGESGLYGCNAWYRSDLRRYLNSYSDNEPCCGEMRTSMIGFLRGFSLDVLNRLVKTENYTYSGQMGSPIQPLYPVDLFSEFDSFFLEHDTKRLHRYYIMRTMDYVWIPSAIDFGFSHRMLKRIPNEQIDIERQKKLRLVKKDGSSVNIRLRDAALSTTANYLTAIALENGNLSDSNASTPMHFMIMLKIRQEFI